MAIIPSLPPRDSYVANWAKVCGQAFGKHWIMECTLDKEIRNLGSHQTSATELSGTTHLTLTNFSLLNEALLKILMIFRSFLQCFVRSIGT